MKLDKLKNDLAVCWKEYHLVVWACAVAMIMYSFLIVHKYLYFGYNDWDSAFYVQSLWNLLHGRVQSSIFGFHCFGSHAEFIDLFLVPVFVFFQHPVTFSIIEIFFFVLSACLLYRMIVDGLGRWPAFLLTLAYLIFPPNFFALCHELNPEKLAPLLFLLAVFFFRKKELLYFYISLLLLSLVKENMPLIVLMFGLWGLAARDRDKVKWGVVPVLFALFYFIVVVKLVIPYFRDMEHHSLWGRFKDLGTTPQEIIANAFRFETWVRVLSTPLNINYIFSLFGILLVPALLSPSLILLIAPILAYHLLSSYALEKTIFFYYGMALTPAIFLAAAQTLSKFRSSHVFKVLICSFFLAVVLFNLSSFWGGITLKTALNAPPEVLDQWRLVRMIPPDAPVIATFKFLPALSLRSELYSFHKVYDVAYQDLDAMKWSDFNVNSVFKVPGNVTYALVDFNDHWLRVALEQDPEYTRNKLGDFFKDWQAVGSSGRAVLFRRISD
jgi:uncharacterized membrane protein